MDFVKESTLLLDLINKLTLNQPILQPPAQGGAFAGRQQGGAPGEVSFLLQSSDCLASEAECQSCDTCTDQPQ